MLTDRQIEQLFATHMAALVRVARSRVYCDSDVDDVLQNAAIALLRHRDRLDPEDAHKWLFTVVKNGTHAVRRGRREVMIDVDEISDLTPQMFAKQFPDPSDEAVRREDAAEIATAMATLTDSQRRAVSGRALGLTYPDMASSYGWTLRKVERSALRGGRRLRQAVAAT